MDSQNVLRVKKERKVMFDLLESAQPMVEGKHIAPALKHPVAGGTERLRARNEGAPRHFSGCAAVG